MTTIELIQSIFRSVQGNLSKQTAIKGRVPNNGHFINLILSLLNY